ncbi:hypothetical protein F4805DRAFT_451778 [Annulohypoxylon moriforme]|nr:hypothetical protein F4805DRAFT_451778 [Annulohypoxylon moriforme]
MATIIATLTPCSKYAETGISQAVKKCGVNSNIIQTGMDTYHFALDVATRQRPTNVIPSKTYDTWKLGKGSRDLDVDFLISPGSKNVLQIMAEFYFHPSGGGLMLKVPSKITLRFHSYKHEVVLDKGQSIYLYDNVTIEFDNKFRFDLEYIHENIHSVTLARTRLLEEKKFIVAKDILAIPNNPPYIIKDYVDHEQGIDWHEERPGGRRTGGVHIWSGLPVLLKQAYIPKAIDPQDRLSSETFDRSLQFWDRLPESSHVTRLDHYEKKDLGERFAYTIITPKPTDPFSVYFFQKRRRNPIKTLSLFRDVLEGIANVHQQGLALNNISVDNLLVVCYNDGAAPRYKGVLSDLTRLSEEKPTHYDLDHIPPEWSKATVWAITQHAKKATFSPQAVDLYDYAFKYLECLKTKRIDPDSIPPESMSGIKYLFEGVEAAPWELEFIKGILTEPITEPNRRTAWDLLNDEVWGKLEGASAGLYFE